MLIRPASEPDLSAVSTIYDDVRLNQFPWLDPTETRSGDFSKDSEGEEIHVAVSEGTVAGFVSVWAPDSFIHHLYVSPAFQGRGVGTRLLAFVSSAYPGPLRLKCARRNRKALKFYRKNGWVVIGEGNSAEGAYLLMESPETAGQGDYGLGGAA